MTLARNPGAGYEVGTDEDRLSFLRLEAIFGDLIRDEKFTALYAATIKDLCRDPNVGAHMDSVLTQNVAIDV